MAILDETLDKIEGLHALLVYSFGWARNLPANKPGFFVPFRSASDAAFTLAAPVWDPIVLGTFSLIAGITAVIGAVVSAASFLTSLPSFCFNIEQAKSSLAFGLASTVVSLALAALSLIAAVSAIVFIPVNVVTLFARVAATAVAQLDFYEAVHQEDAAGCCI